MGGEKAGCGRRPGAGKAQDQVHDRGGPAARSDRDSQEETGGAGGRRQGAVPGVQRPQRHGAVPVRRRHPQRVVRPRRHRGARRAPAPGEDPGRGRQAGGIRERVPAVAIPLPVDRIRRRLHRKLAVRLDRTGAVRIRRRRVAQAGRPAQGSREGAPRDRVAARLQQLPHPQAGAVFRRHLDGGRALRPQPHPQLARHPARCMPDAAARQGFHDRHVLVVGPRVLLRDGRICPRRLSVDDLGARHRVAQSPELQSVPVRRDGWSCRAVTGR